MPQRDVVVVGAGPAGISAALALRDVGVGALVLDRAEQVASSWRSRYDRLRLNSPRGLSHLPGRRFPAGTAKFPTRDQVVEYLDGHAREVEVQLGVHVDRIAPDRGRWIVHTSGSEIRTRQVIVATGYERQPLTPDWPGRESFTGRLLHSGDYGNPEPYRGARVLVVGAGCSGMEIAYDLVEGGAAKVCMAVRTPPNIVLREGPGGLPGDYIGLTLMRLPVRFGDWLANVGREHDLGDLSEYGLPVPQEGVFARMKRLGVAPAVVDRPVIEAIKDGRIEVVRGVESLDATGVNLSGGARVEPDAVICATGYRAGLEPLVGDLDVLDSRGVPNAMYARPAAPGLRFLGYVRRPAALGYMATEAKRAAKAIARELREATVA